MRPLRDTDVKRLHRTWRRRTEQRLALVLDHVQTPFNVGAIVRTAAALRLEHLWLVGATSPAAAKARKTSLGTERYLTWSEAADVGQAATEARADGYRVVGLELAEGAVPLMDADLADDVCLVLGHEDRGVGSAALAACDTVAYVPLVGRVGSLNVSQAAAIALYECRRQGWAAAHADSRA